LNNHDQTTAFGVYSVLKSTLVTDWSIENMNSDMTHKQDAARSVDVSVSPKEKNMSRVEDKWTILKSACQKQFFF
jgi:hypothetical protein